MSDFGKYFNIGLNLGMLNSFCGLNLGCFNRFSFCNFFPYTNPINSFNIFQPPVLNTGYTFNSSPVLAGGSIFNAFPAPVFSAPSISITSPNPTSTNPKHETSHNNSSKASKYWANMTDEEMKEVYGNYDYDITKPYKGSAENLDKVLGGVLAGKGQAFMDAQQKYGINAAALAAICMLESGNGKSSIAKNNNNVSGMGGQGNWKKFNSVEECIDKTASLLKNNYITPPEKGKVKSLTKLYQINSRYCPGKETASNTGWAAKVTQNLKKIEYA